MKIAIIGAGAAGLAAASVLQRAHTITVFEQRSVLGGLWNADEDLQQTALYPSLRTNLPARLMEFFDFPFHRQLIPTGQGDYPGPFAVAAYLQAYAAHHQLTSKIQFNTEVARVHPIDRERWAVELRGGQTHPFDAVVVCSGHYTEPNRPVLEGSEQYGSKILHAKDYVNPDRFRGTQVLVWGSKASGIDLVREISTTAKQVYWCGHDPGLNQLVTDRDNVSVHKDPISLHRDHIQLTDGERLPIVDHLLQCTGYQYHFPFLDAELLTIDDNLIQGLYQHILLAKRPTLAFIGLPYLVIPFPLFLIQSQWLNAHFSGRLKLPSTQQLIALSEAHVAQHLTTKAQPRHFHRLGADQLAYLTQLIDDATLAPLPAAFLARLKVVHEIKQAHPHDFRAIELPSRLFHDPRPA
ncbi:MAG: thioredoxin reductase [Candidatus Azotimanducaceae bacterium]|jgi:thioredoxin reductase|tara:strand:- start:329 stop:1555 length:1227 start_codon:yes stop_codon:yes gene_type:complete